jgi:hypothetical protein
VPRPTDASTLTFFVDRSLGARDVPEALRAAGTLVEVHDDHFAPDTPDTIWLAEVGARGWVVLTKDSRIRRHPLELQSLLAADVAAFMLTATDLTGADMGRVLVTAIPRLTTLVRSRARPFIATISRQGQVTIIQGGARRGGVRKT